VYKLLGVIDAEHGPERFLEHPAIGVLAPWCVRLDNLELVIALALQPVLAPKPLRRAELEEQLMQLADRLPCGPVYLQRVIRAVARLEEAGILRGTGASRSRRFTLTPEGFAALLVNLRVFDADPTINGGEFELKKEITSVWHLTIDQAKHEGGLSIAVAPELRAFWDKVVQVTIAGMDVMPPDVVADTLNIFRLIDRQRQRLLPLIERERAELKRDEEKVAFFRTADFTTVAAMARPGVEMTREMWEGLRLAAQTNAFVHTSRSKLLRYQSFLDYLDSLDALYRPDFKEIAFEDLRRLAKGRR
jgi:hypothetical protein